MTSCKYEFRRVQTIICRPTVDAYAAAIPFYLKNGFVPLNDEDIDEPTRLLYFDLNDLNED